METIFAELEKLWNDLGKDLGKDLEKDLEALAEKGEKDIRRNWVRVGRKLGFLDFGSTLILQNSYA